MSEGAIKAGMLRHRVRVRKNAQTTRNVYGEMVPESYQTVATIWARVAPVSARESSEADRVEARVTHRVLTHYRDDITADMQLVLIADGDRVLQIKEIRDLGGQHRGMELIAEEVA